MRRRALLPPPAWTGRPRSDDRRALEGILFVLRSGCRWQDLPRRYGAPTTVWRHLKIWQEDGTWLRLWRTILARLDAQGHPDWRYAYLDGSFAPAKKGGEAVGLTRNGKGTKWMLMVDGQGLPLGLYLASAQQAEVARSAQTAAGAPGGRPGVRQRGVPPSAAPTRHRDVHPAKAPPQDMATETRPPGRCTA